MKLVPPIAITPAILTATSVPEADYPAWSALTTYALGARVVRLHRVYESVVAGNLDRDPVAAGPASWLDIGPTNRWAMFDAGTGSRTTAGGTITVTLSPGQPATALALLDLVAASVRVQVSDGATLVYDTTRDAPAETLALLDLPAVAAPTIVVTIAPTGGEAGAGKLVIGVPVDLGVTETNPTITLVDYSRRDTDDFGVTTVVPRSWAKRIALRTRIAADRVDAVQREMVAVRATAALWLGEPGLEALTIYGFFKEFELALAVGESSFYTLTVEGLPETLTGAPIADPAPSGPSDFKVIRPVPITGAALTASNVAENDYPEWSAITNYGLGERVIRAAQHRVYESAVEGNVGFDPAGGPVQWLDVGPTNRWAMFDQALGSVTSAPGQIVVALAPGAPITGLALLDTAAATVRVQAPGYDRTQAVTKDAALTFLDLATAAGASITVTIAAANGASTASVGTLVVGTVELLGQTETAPTVGITDYSRKTTDAFGTTTVAARAWAKRMAVRSLITAGSINGLVRRMASLRATPALWIGSEGFDSLAVYGFYRDFSVGVTEQVGTCSVTIEGLSTAAPLPAASSKVRWLGDWQADESYPLNGVVRHNGRSFASLITGNLGHEPPLTADDNAFWYLVSDRGEDGSNGIPGAPGANGLPSYVHIAYANSADGAAGFSTTISAGKLYIGVYTDFTEPDSTNPTLYSWSKIKGEDGTQGTQGIPGAPGSNGQPSYFHIAYADNATGTMNFTTGSPGARTYIGVYSDAIEADSTNPAAYAWSKYVGADGSQGIPGAPGANGQPSYVHLAWANSADGSTGFSTTVSTGKLYIGVYSDQTAADSANPALYHWSKIRGDDGLQGSQGVPGAPGSNGQTTYFHTAYADSADGFSNFTTGDAGARAYIGVYTDFTAADSSSPGAYTWSRFKGFDGGQGIPGAPGANGLPSYVHFAWANAADGSSGFSTTVSAGKLYLGVYSDFTAASSTNPAAYSWSLIKGNDGLQGSQGVPGAPGSNGLTSYVHFAYADSADGSANFTTGAADGRYYVGVYVDFATADSTNPAAYTWSLQRGANGSNGTPGAPGANGQPSYVHTAYASSADGSSNFDLSDPSGRTYLGVYSDFTLADSTNPAAYTWSLIKGADGAPGTPGAPGAPAVSPIVMTLSAYSIDVAADYNNVTKTGSLPKSSTVSLMQGTTPIAPLSVYFVYSDGGNGAFAATYDSSSQVVSLSTANAAGWIDVVAIYSAQQYAQRISITRSKDPTPPPSQTSTSASVSGGNYPLSTSYGGAIMVPELVLKANGSGVINCAFEGEYYADQDPSHVRTLRIAARFEVAPQSSGVFSAPVSEEVGSQSTWDKSDVSPGMISMSRAITGLTPNDTYRLRISLRKAIGSNDGGYINYGTFSVSQ